MVLNLDGSLAISEEYHFFWDWNKSNQVSEPLQKGFLFHDGFDVIFMLAFR